MPVRGKKSIWPSAPKKPTGIFGQPQKKDSTADMPYQSSRNYANPQPRAAKIGKTLMQRSKMQ